jgi:uncharacterized membrane protein
MRVLVLLLFLVLAVAAVGVVAYRYRVNELRTRHRRDLELTGPKTPQERYAAGEIDLDELDRLLGEDLKGRS